MCPIFSTNLHFSFSHFAGHPVPTIPLMARITNGVPSAFRPTPMVPMPSWLLRRGDNGIMDQWAQTPDGRPPIWRWATMNIAFGGQKGCQRRVAGQRFPPWIWGLQLVSPAKHLSIFEDRWNFCGFDKSLEWTMSNAFFVVFQILVFNLFIFNCNAFHIV